VNTSIVRLLKDRCLTYLEHKIELQDIHFAAAMLNPNYRTLRQATKAEQTQAQKFLRRRIEMIIKSTASPEQSASSSDSDDNNRHYLSKYTDNPPISRKQDELTRYLKFDHRETSSNDILEFWSTMADSLPTLAKVAFQILTIPATSANVERSFSAAGQVISERRSNISPDLVNDILFLRSTKK
jgi:hAT family C-terminal dimerisation region